MDYKVELQQIIDYIDTHIKDEFSPALLADRIGVSQKHFYRLFKSNVGMPVMTYIRRRRLSYALHEILQGRRVLDVALDYGFDSHNGFTKAFKRTFGASPLGYASHVADVLPHPINLLSQSERFKIFGGVVMEPKIVQRAAFRIAGYGIRTNGAKSTQDCPALWDQHNIEGGEEKLYAQLHPKSHGEYGVCCENNMQTGEFVYMIGVEVEDFKNTTEDMVRVEVPQAQYAVFTTSPINAAEFSRNIQNTWDYILREWLPNSGYIWDEAKPDFEFYDERCHGGIDKVMEIHVPVSKK